MKRQRLDIRDWEAFVTLTRLRHFGHAADELGITQSAISQRIAKLEGDLRLKLLIRSNQGVEPTDAGRALLPEARALIAAKRNALEAAAAIREEGARPLRLLLSNAIIHTAILPRLRHALEEAQGSAFQVDVEAADEVESSLASGECDLALTTLPMAREDIEERLLTRLPMAVAVPADVELKQVHIKTLCRHPLLMVPRDTEPDLFDRLLVAARSAGQVLQVAQPIVAFPSILAMVAMGKGWGIVPLAMKGATPDGVKVLPLQMREPPVIRVFMSWRSSNVWAGKLVGALKSDDYRPD
ncbi:LysR family transcriptional regulator [Denitrobaculum tricleocarpae]|uniref:LysR family transcriptional regulator n=1 Tax=Denitrobaculum tricleocarpae TaxID=2591009 RepID=A0A545SSX2_9PROT|nr:LysR family transcriptional regulator [Denitrobaculum tricleocarpae]TQV68078.1 LysR family transcriptional regulator [Denitrobaculum tricleocarpae]